ERGFVVRLGDGPPQFRVREAGPDGGPSTLDASNVDEMRRGLDASRAVARLVLIPGGTGGESRVVMALHHAVADACAGLAVLERLWRAYTALVTGAAPVPAGTMTGAEVLAPSA